MKKQPIILLMLFVAICAMPRHTKAQIFFVRANALAAFSGTLNLGAEVSVSDK